MTDTTTDPTTDPAAETAADPTRAIDTHLRAYCEPDATVRAELVAAAWEADGVLVDPPFDGAGHDGIAAMADAVLAHYPAHTFERTTEVDAHHAFARYGWALVAPDGTPAVTGTDVVEFGEGGRIARVVGFFGDPVPAA
ncbi:hypothetical protein [Dermatobacter hominis]|uniref:hypothetical protein n=1 Tax=Dermatobacter hominis TaxID=2884263 RepID=UPI001D0F9A20|nr:hypothetical protein [Dermatobacter hominis]UDY36160.1 hypothetical protein LH044_01160 [Dermatobacter hominis]